MLLERESIRLLVEVGLLAAKQADVRRAERIFRALELLRPEGVFVYAGLGVAYLHAGRMVDALVVLDRGLQLVAAADRAELHALRGMALQMSGRISESRQAFIRAGDLPLAKAMLGERPQTVEGM